MAAIDDELELELLQQEALLDQANHDTRFNFAHVVGLAVRPQRGVPRELHGISDDLRTAVRRCRVACESDC